MRTQTDGVAVVTGAGSGLGRALAIELCARGQQVVGLGRRAEALAETATLAGEQFTAIATDIANPDAVRAAFENMPAPVTCLINNAGVYPHRDFLDETAESFMQTVDINLGGMVACTRAALEDMGKTGVGRIVNVSSFADLSPMPCSAAYSVSKGACTTFSRALVADIGDRLPGIVISTWMPGMLRTDMGVPGGLEPAVAAKWGATLAMDMRRDLNGTLWEMDREMLPARGIKGRIKDTLLLRRRQSRRL